MKRAFRGTVFSLSLCWLITGCAMDEFLDPEPPTAQRQGVTYPYGACSTYPPNSVGEHRYHVARDEVICPDPIPPLTNSDGAARASKVLLTTNLINQMKLNRDQLANLQFYNSHRIVLQRELAGADQFVEGGRLVSRDGRYIDQVVIEKGTPGVATEINDRFIKIDFGQGSPLFFGRPGPAKRFSRNPLHQAYRLLGYGWEYNNTGRVNFNNAVYRLLGSSAVAALLIDHDELSKRTTQRRVLPGRSLYGTPTAPYDYNEEYGAFIPQ